MLPLPLPLLLLMTMTLMHHAVQERVVRLMKEKETWREGGGSSASGKRSGGSSR